MANQGYLPLDGGETLVRFVVQQCALNPLAPVDPKQEKKNIEEGVGLVTAAQVTHAPVWSAALRCGVVQDSTVH